MAVLETELERDLRVALAPLAEVAGEGMTDQPWIAGYAGWRPGREPTLALLDALDAARPFAENLAAIWGEHCDWQKLRDDRAAAIAGYEFPAHVAARIAALEFVMDNVSDASAEGLRTRLAWLDHLSKLDTYRTSTEASQLAQLLAADFEQFVINVQSGQVHNSVAPTTSAHRTQAERRQEVLSILSSDPHLSDREIARRVGVSPQTVSTCRRKMSPSG